MKILFLSQDYPPQTVGGVGVYTYEIARQLVRLGHEAFVITRAIESPCQYEDQGVHVYRIKPISFSWLKPIADQFFVHRFIERLEYSYSLAQKIEELVRDKTIDIIESYESRTEGFWYYLFHRSPPLVIKLHTPDKLIFQLNQEVIGLDQKLILYIEEWWLRRATQLVGLTDSIVKLVAQNYQMDLTRIPIVLNPIDLHFFSPSREIYPNNKRVLYVGRLEFRKGIHVLINAIPRVLEKIPEAEFIFVGADCGMKSYLLEQMALPQYRHKIRWMGPVPREELLSSYWGSQVCVIPSLWENHPIVCLEAIGCGKAVVASNIGGLSELIQDGENGMLFSVGSSRQLADKLIALLSDVNQCQKMGEKARKLIEEKYNPERVARQTIQVYEQVIASRN